MQKYLKHKTKGFLILYSVAMESDEYEVIEEVPEPPVEPPPPPPKTGSRLKPAE
jgi:hypothetical protein